MSPAQKEEEAGQEQEEQEEQEVKTLKCEPLMMNKSRHLHFAYILFQC